MRVLVYSTGIVRNKLICEYANVVCTSSSSHPHTHTHTLIPFEHHEPTGLKVDIAASAVWRDTSATGITHIPALQEQARLCCSRQILPYVYGVMHPATCITHTCAP